MVGFLLAVGFQITLEESFPLDVREELQVLAEEVFAVVQERMPGEPPAGERPIVCFVRPEGPITDGTSDTSIYHIGLSEHHRNYPRFAYQLGHELGHVMLDPRRTNSVLESMAIAISLQVLDDLAERWLGNPPEPFENQCVQEFRRYVGLVEDKAVRGLPKEIREAVRGDRWNGIRAYLRYRQRDQDAAITDESLNILAAMAVRSGPVPWPSFKGLGGHTDPPPSEDGRFRNDLSVDLAEAPDIVCRMGRVCEGRILAARFRNCPETEEGIVFQEGDEWMWVVEAVERKSVEEEARRQGAIRVAWEE